MENYRYREKIVISQIIPMRHTARNSTQFVWVWPNKKIEQIKVDCPSQIKIIKCHIVGKYHGHYLMRHLIWLNNKIFSQKFAKLCQR